MNGYYAFVIDRDGHIANRIEIRCDDDEEAKCCANGGERDCEPSRVETRR